MPVREESLFSLCLLSLEQHHVVRDGCINVEASLGHPQYRRQQRLEQQGRDHASLHETMQHVQLIRALAIIELRACAHAVVKLADDGQHFQGHANRGRTSHRGVQSTGSYAFVTST